MLLRSPKGMLKAKPPERSVLTKMTNEGFIVIELVRFGSKFDVAFIRGSIFWFTFALKDYLELTDA